MRRSSCVSAGSFVLPALLLAGAMLILGSAARAADPAPPPAGDDAERKAAAKIEEALDKEIPLDFQDAPLTEVLSFLRDATDVNIFLDTKALANVGIGSDTPVVHKSKNVRLRAALAKILAEHSLTFIVRDEVLLVTTAEEANALLDTRIHSAADLLPDVNAEEQAVHVELLKAAVQAADPAVWDEVGGPFGINVYRRQLVVNANSEMHRQVAGVLDLLRSAKPAAGQKLPAVLRRESKQEQKVRAELESKTKAEFVDTPLTEVVQFLSDLHAINVMIDRKALNDGGIGADSPVTINLSGVTLRAALTHMLRPIGPLVAVVRNDALLITTPEAAAAQMSLAAYPIGDLGPCAPGAVGPTLAATTTADELRDTITLQLAPQSWEDVGGAGVVRVVCSPPLLVVRQTDDAHRQIESFLTQLRAKAAQSPPVVDRPVEKVYVLVNLNGVVNQAGKPELMPTADELAKLIVETIEPESWNKEGILIKSVTGRLLVRHHPAVQQKIEKLLSELQVFVGPLGGGMGGGGFGGGIPVVGSRQGPRQ